jgi:hypothetical protein
MLFGIQHMLGMGSGYTYDEFQLQLQQRGSVQRNRGYCSEWDLYILSICSQYVVHMLTMVVAMGGGVGGGRDGRVIKVSTAQGHAGHMLNLRESVSHLFHMCWECAEVMRGTYLGGVVEEIESKQR